MRSALAVPFGGFDVSPVGPITGILFLYLMSQALVYGIYCVIQKEENNSRDVSGFPIKIVLEEGETGRKGLRPGSS